MNRKQLYRHALVSFIEPCAANATALGVMAGAVGYAGHILGLPVPIYSWLSSVSLPDILVSFVLLPLVAALIGAIMGLVGYLLTTLMLALLKAVRGKDSSVQPNRPMRTPRPSEQHQAKAA